jgi:hypothetical protein
MNQRICLIYRRQAKNVSILKVRVPPKGFSSDPHHFNADPDPAFHFNADPDSYPALHFNQDPYAAPHQGDANLRPLLSRASRASFRASRPQL